MIKNVLKHLVIKVLAWESKLIIKKYHPKIIGVAGNIGKTSTKDAIFSVISKHYPTRKSEKSYNSDFGVPLTLIGRPTAWSSLWGWLAIMAEGLHLILVKHPYPEWLVLEVGADRPGDIKRIASWLACDIVVMTTIPEIPVHIEFFKDRQELVEEKFALPLSLGAGQTVILNIDDPCQQDLEKRIKSLPESARPEILTYGQSEQADLSARDVFVEYSNEGERRWPGGIGFSLVSNGERLPINLSGVIGKHHVYIALAALSVAKVLGLNLSESGATIATHEASPGRLRPILGVKDTLIIDDSYNASPDAVKAALDTLRSVDVAGRRIAVLGDMMELGSYTIDAHRSIGAATMGACDYLLTVGVRSKFIAEGAREKGMADDHIGIFDDSRAAGQWLQNFIQPGDVILVKGSQLVRLEKTVEEIMAHPEDKEKLLVRQEPEWQER